MKRRLIALGFLILISSLSTYSLVGKQSSGLTLLGVGSDKAPSGTITPPTLIDYKEVPWNTTTTSKATTSISWQTNDIIVVIAGQEGTTIFTAPTATGLTFTQQKLNTAASTCNSGLWTAVAGSSSSGAVTTVTSSSSNWGFGVWVLRGSAGVGNSVEQHTGGSAPTESVSLTPTAAHSTIIWGTFDFQAASLGTIVPTPTNTRQRVVIGSNYTIYVSDLHDQSSTGGTLYGVSGAGSTTGPFSIVAQEIKGQ